MSKEFLICPQKHLLLLLLDCTTCYLLLWALYCFCSLCLEHAFPRKLFFAASPISLRCLLNSHHLSEAFPVHLCMSLSSSIHPWACYLPSISEFSSIYHQLIYKYINLCICSLFFFSTHFPEYKPHEVINNYFVHCCIPST